MFYSNGIDTHLVGMFVSVDAPHPYGKTEGVIRSAIPAAAFMDDRCNVLLKIETKTRGVVSVLVPFTSKYLQHLLPKG